MSKKSSNPSSNPSSEHSSEPGTDTNVDLSLLQTELDKLTGEASVNTTSDLNEADIETTDQTSHLHAEIDSLKQQAQAEKDRALRAIAELDNFRKRKEQEVESFKKYAYEKVVTEFLSVLDGFTLAKDQVKPGSDLSSVLEGYQSIEKQFMSVLEKLGVKPIDALNQPFDPNKHQAVMQETVEGVAPDIVVKELQKGFQLHDRVIRPTMVAVSQ